jgi:hypothetical protein
LKKLLEKHIERIGRKVIRLEKQSSKISGLRLGLFIATLFFAFVSAEYLPGWLYSIILIGMIGGFLAAIDRHRKVEECIEQFGYLKQIKKEHIARIDLDWENISYKDLDLSEYSNHPYAQDFNIIGERSLFQLMDTSIYDGSREILLKWMLKQNLDKQEVAERQKLVNELAPLQLFRDKLQVEASFTKGKTGKNGWSMEDMLEWLRLPKKTGLKLPLVILFLLSACNITLGVLALIGELSAVFFVITFVSYLTVSKLNSEKVKGLFDAAFQMDNLLGSFSNILNYVERFKVNENKKVSHFLRVYQEEKEKPSKRLRKVRRFAIAASVQKNQVLGPLVNLFVPWDLYYAMKLENLKEDIEPKLTKWLDKFYELEALNSLANFTLLNSQYSFPTFQKDSNTLFKADKLGHPLILESQKVANDFQVKEGKDLFLITGSNMAGKSTFLRTVGINLVLAYSGAPVNAESMNTNFYRLFSSINTQQRR